MTNIQHYVIGDSVRYVVQLSPSFKVEANTLAELLSFLYKYGGYDV